MLIIIISFSGYLIYTAQKEEEKQMKENVIPGVQVFLSDHEISAIIVEEDIVYVGGRDGIFVVDIETGDILEVLTRELSLIYTASMIKSSSGDIWIGHDSGLSLYSNESWTHFEKPEIPEGRCNKIIEENSLIYAGFQEGSAILELDLNNKYRVIKTLTKENGLAENNVNSIYKDNYNNFWYGAYLSNQIGGLSIDKESGWQYVSVDEGLPHKYVTDIKAFDYDGVDYILVGSGHLTSGGIALFTTSDDELNLIKTYLRDDGIPGDKIRSLYVSEEEDIWITTESDGLVITNASILLGEESIKGIYLDKKSGLSDNEIKIVGENNKYYILGGRFGITRILKSSIEQLKKDSVY